ncbi:hypothetical protein [Xanthomonas oryzae]|uniref:hypothetical protein n=1 Tax=Xanthomonas oryzae TaxID=347 RepID=UPI001F048210|nr:hypothetical protein [Xanthomonas oryzae]
MLQLLLQLLGHQSNADAFAMQAPPALGSEMHCLHIPRFRHTARANRQPLATSFQLPFDLSPSTRAAGRPFDR